MDLRRARLVQDTEQKTVGPQSVFVFSEPMTQRLRPVNGQTRNRHRLFNRALFVLFLPRFAEASVLDSAGLRRSVPVARNDW